MVVVFDSTVLIDALRGRPAGRRIEALQSSGDVPSTTAINVEEITRGMRASEMDVVNRLFEGLQILPIGRWEGWQAGEWRRAFAERGVTLSQADCLIAATTHLIGAKLATGNPDDFPMAEVIVEHWPVGA